MNEDQFWNLLAKKLAGEASEQEETELALLIKANHDLSFTAQHVADVWRLEQPANKEEAENAFQKHFSRLSCHQTNYSSSDSFQEEGISTLPIVRRRWIFSSFILLATIALGIAIFVWSNAKESTPKSISKQTEEIYTRPGTTTKLVLPDSSVVWLNAGSKLTYSQPFGLNNRVVTLSGEAFFNVVKSEKPFIINTSGAQIKVLGTVFNVRNYANEKKIETSLISGRVEITVDESPEKKYVLKPNEKLTLNTEESNGKNTKGKNQAPLAVISTIHYLDSSTVAETSWINNKLVFADESFTDIAKKMERWYGISIHFKNEKIQNERFTGVFEKETVWQALEAMQMITPFHFTMKENEISITN